MPGQKDMEIAWGPIPLITVSETDFGFLPLIPGSVRIDLNCSLPSCCERIGESVVAWRKKQIVSPALPSNLKGVNILSVFDQSLPKLKRSGFYRACIIKEETTAEIIYAYSHSRV